MHTYFPPFLFPTSDSIMRQYIKENSNVNVNKSIAYSNFRYNHQRKKKHASDNFENSISKTRPTEWTAFWLMIRFLSLSSALFLFRKDIHRLTDSPDSSRPAAPSTRIQKSSGASDRAPDVTPLRLFRDNMAVVIAGWTGMRESASLRIRLSRCWVAATLFFRWPCPSYARSSPSSLYGDPLPSRESTVSSIPPSQRPMMHRSRDASSRVCVVGDRGRLTRSLLAHKDPPYPVYEFLRNLSPRRV